MPCSSNTAWSLGFNVSGNGTNSPGWASQTQLRVNLVAKPVFQETCEIRQVWACSTWVPVGLVRYLSLSRTYPTACNRLQYFSSLADFGRLWPGCGSAPAGLSASGDRAPKSTRGSPLSRGDFWAISGRGLPDCKIPAQIAVAFSVVRRHSKAFFQCRRDPFA